VASRASRGGRGAARGSDRVRRMPGDRRRRGRRCLGPHRRDARARGRRSGVGTRRVAGGCALRGGAVMDLRSRGGGPPEDSRALRVVVAVAVELGVLAVVLQGAVDSTAAAAALVLAPAGYVFSYVRRRRSGVMIKAILAIGLLLALDRFVGQVRFAT